MRYCKQPCILLILLLLSVSAAAQDSLRQFFKDCGVQGSTTIYDYRNRRWVFTDSLDANRTALPASTFKVINLLIALQTGVIKDENEVIKWVGKTDTVRYGYRPDIYRDMTVKEAFQVSAGWAFIELAKKIGRETYRRYLRYCNYGNQDLSEKDPDFWNIGKMETSPVNQVTFLINVYEERLPFSPRNFEILKRVMITEQTDDYIIRSKTGWTRENGMETGWWIGYVERRDNVYFFATRLLKPRSEHNPNFGNCRKQVTRRIMKALNILQ